MFKLRCLRGQIRDFRWRPWVWSPAPGFLRLAWIPLVAFAFAGCGDKERHAMEAQSNMQMQAERARLNLQKKADELARNPPPELIEAARREAQQSGAK